MEILFLLGRILFGGYFLMNGMNHFMKHKMMTDYTASKKVPAASLAVYATGLMLLGGGTGVLLGAYIQLAVLLLVLFLVAAAFKMHVFWSEADPMQKMVQMLFFTRNMALVGASLMMLAIPAPWPYSIWF